jgi:uncharacterized protein (TIGR02246 family)
MATSMNFDYWVGYRPKRLPCSLTALTARSGSSFEKSTRIVESLALRSSSHFYEPLLYRDCEVPCASRSIGWGVKEMNSMQSDEHEIRQLVETWMAASKAGDTEKVLSLMAEDVVFLMAGRPPMIGKSAFAAAAQAQSIHGPVQFDGASEIQEIKVLGEWAFMWARLTVRGHSARRCSADDPCRAYAFDPQKAKRQVGPGA